MFKWGSGKLKMVFGGWRVEWQRAKREAAEATERAARAKESQQQLARTAEARVREAQRLQQQLRVTRFLRRAAVRWSGERARRAFSVWRGPSNPSRFFCVSVCAARTLTVTDQPRVTLSVR